MPDFVLVRRDDIDFDPSNAKPPTDDEIDGLCAIKAAAKSSLGRETDYWWERREDGRWRYDNTRERLQRQSDRDLMRQFLSALTGQKP